MKTIISIILSMLILPSLVSAATHYVSPNGNASWAQSTNINTPCSVGTAGANADEGDIVYFRGGDYGDPELKPKNSGSPGKPITFSRYKNETVSFTSGVVMVLLEGVSYAVIDGFTFSGGKGGGHIALVKGSHYVEVKNCEFSGSDGHAIRIKSSDYFYLHDNTFYAQDEAQNEYDEKDSIAITTSSYGRIIGNTFYDGGGHIFIWISFSSHYNIIRGNTGRITDYWNENEKHALDKYVAYAGNSTFGLIEDNLWIQDLDATKAQGNPLSAERCQNVIVRRNQHIGCRGNTHFWAGNVGNDIENNTFYHNTYYHTNRFYSQSPGVFSLGFNHGVYTLNNQFVNNIIHTARYHGFKYACKFKIPNDPSSGCIEHILDNEFRNNILYNIDRADVYRYQAFYTISDAQTVYPDEFIGNLTSDPKLTDPDNLDVTLQEGSPAIDSGAWLTTITSATGSGTTFTVDNPNFFFDGWGIPDETGDIIETENGQTATITSIDYSTGEITVNSSISWTQNEGIALPYHGSKPDIGAFEYGSNNDSAYTVGNTTKYADKSTSSSRRASKFAMPEDGTISSITMYHDGGSGNVIYGLYADDNGLPGARLGTTASTAVSGSDGWQTIDLEAPVYVSNGTSIWLAWVYENNPGVYYQWSRSQPRAVSPDDWSGGMPNPFGSSETATFDYSIYATYTPGDGSTLLDDSFNDGPVDNWSVLSGTWSVSDNQYQQTATSGRSVSHYANGTSWTNYTYSVDVKCGYMTGITFRGNSDMSDYYVFRFKNSAQVQFGKVDNGNWSSLQTYTYNNTAGQTYTMTAIVDGSNITLKINDTIITDTLTHTSFSSGTVGFYTYRTAGTFDNVLVTTD